MGKKKNKEQSVDRVTKYFKDGIVDYHSISCHVSHSQKPLIYVFLCILAQERRS